MALFIGEHRSKLDDKGRMVFPAAFKGALAASAEKTLVVQKDFYQKCLSIYTTEAWESLATEMKSKLNLLNKEQRDFWRKLMSLRAEVTPDERSSRILIPRRLLDLIEADKEVVFIGFDDHIEIWSAAKYEASDMSDEDFAAAAEKYFG
jgi:MraZ protein